MISVGKQPTKQAASEQLKITHHVESSKKFGAKDPRQLRITKELVSFVAQDMVALSIVESKPFKRFIYIALNHDINCQLGSSSLLSY